MCVKLMIIIRHELVSQTGNKVIKIEVNDVVYKLKNPNFSTVDELCDQLAEKLYEKVRASTSDVACYCRKYWF